MELVLYNGKIYLGEGKFAAALLLRDGLVAASGTDSEIRAMACADAETIDLRGRLAVPGFNDTHMHLLETAKQLRSVRLNQCTSIESLIAAYRERVGEYDENTFLIGRGWNDALFTDAYRPPNRLDLDRISTTVPIMAVRVCGHVTCCNTRALELAGITADTQVSGGEIVLGPDGMPNGVLLEHAGRLLHAKVREFTKEELIGMIRGAMEYAVSVGLTSVHSDDMRAENYSAIHAIYAGGFRKLRVSRQVRFTDPENLRAYLSGESVLETEGFDCLCRVKMLIDGSLGGRTGLMTRPYADDPTTCGIATMTQETFDTMLDLCHTYGKPIGVHCIGDGGVDMVLNGYARLYGDTKGNPLRHALIHCQITRQDQLDRIVENDILVFAQPVFINSDWRICPARVGAELAKTSYAFGTLLRHGIHLSYGTDSPVESLRPVDNIHCAVNRTDLSNMPEGGYYPEEKVTVQQAIDAYTAESSYASFEENVKGKLLPGFYADVTVLDSDLFTIDPLTIKDTKVDVTITAGKVVYERK